MRRRRIGFSIVEILVALGVIAVLTGLLMPVMSGVRAESRSVACTNNLRQIFLAVQTYRQNAKDVMPFAEPLPAPTPDGPLGGLNVALKSLLPVDCKCYQCAADFSEDFDALGTSYLYTPGAFMLTMQSGTIGMPGISSLSEFENARRIARHITQLFDNGYLSAFPVLGDSAPRHDYGERLPENVVLMDGSARPRKPADSVVEQTAAASFPGPSP